MLITILSLQEAISGIHWLSFSDALWEGKGLKIRQYLLPFPSHNASEKDNQWIPDSLCFLNYRYPGQSVSSLYQTLLRPISSRVPTIWIRVKVTSSLNNVCWDYHRISWFSTNWNLCCDDVTYPIRKKPKTICLRLQTVQKCRNKFW